MAVPPHTQEQQMIVDTLIHARWIIPVEPESVTPTSSPSASVQWHDHHSLVIDGGRIIDLLPSDLARDKIPG